MASKKGLNNTNLKQENRGLILKKIVTGECNTRINLAKKTGLSKMSVSNIINEFIEQKIVCEQETEKTEGQGRNPITLSMTDHAPKIVGLNIHRTECVAVLSDMQLQILRIARCPLTDENSADFFPLIFRLIDQVMEKEQWDHVLGIGIGSSGPIDIAHGIILNPPDFHGLQDLKITSVLQEHYQTRVYMDSQYNSAAMAEKYYGVGRPYRDLLFVGIARGIGSGIIADDKIYHSTNGFTSELGHISIDWNGNHCSCGNRGCLETYAGSEVIRQRLAQITGEQKSFQEFCMLAQENTLCLQSQSAYDEKDMVVSIEKNQYNSQDSSRDKKQEKNPDKNQNNKQEKNPDKNPEKMYEQIDMVFRDMMEKLACGITSVVNMLNSEAVIIGHEGYYIPDQYLELLEERINRQKLSGNYRHVAVHKPYFKREAHILGCACIVLSKVFEGKCEF